MMFFNKYIKMFVFVFGVNVIVPDCCWSFSYNSMWHYLQDVY